MLSFLIRCLFLKKWQIQALTWSFTFTPSMFKTLFWKEKQEMVSWCFLSSKNFFKQKKEKTDVCVCGQAPVCVVYSSHLCSKLFSALFTNVACLNLIWALIKWRFASFPWRINSPLFCLMPSECPMGTFFDLFCSLHHHVNTTKSDKWIYILRSEDGVCIQSLYISFRPCVNKHNYIEAELLNRDIYSYSFRSLIIVTYKALITKYTPL